MDYMIALMLGGEWLAFITRGEWPLRGDYLPWWWCAGHLRNKNGVEIQRLLPGEIEPHFEAYYWKAWRIAYAILGNEDDAHEAVCTAFLCVHEIPKEPEDLWRYIAEAVRNRAIDLRRQKGSRRTNTLATDDFDRREGFALPAELEAMIRERDYLLHEAVSELPEPYRETIVLYYFEGMTQSEVAERMGVPLHTVNNRLHKGRLMLRLRLINTIGRDLGIVPELEPAA